MEQGTTEWHNARKGLVTASKVYDVIARDSKGKFYAKRNTYLMQLVAEIITGEATVSVQSSAMKWGTEMESEARDEYRKKVFQEVHETGFVVHPRIPGSGASPDGLVGEDGLVEIKCPNTITFIDVLLNDEVPENYHAQMQWQMACTGRKWCDFFVYDPRMPVGLRSHLKRVERDDMFISTTEEMVERFIKEVGDKVNELKEIAQYREGSND
jgi:putative phage-type endonuclease